MHDAVLFGDDKPRCARRAKPRRAPVTIDECEAGDEVTLRVDEASGTRIRVAKSAVQQVLKSSGRGGESAEPEEMTAAS